jgi:hypothetical protein
MAEQKVPIACNMTVFDDNQRLQYNELIKRLAEERQEIREELEGYSFRFRAGYLIDLAEWVVLERLCCPFLEFTINVSPDDGPVWLTLGNGKEIKDFLKQEFVRAGAVGLWYSW